MAIPTSFPDDLLGETAQLRALARTLLFDRHSADDVVQDAWLALLSAGQRPREAGAWLNGTVRRLVHHRVRDEARRGRREEEAAREERVPSAVEASGRIEILRNLLTAVEALDAPYREIIELRFFENLPPRTIARRIGLPVNTVRTRVRRGIEQLRARLDREHEGRREELLAVLLPLAGPPPFALAGSVSLVSWTGTSLMMKKLLAAAVLLLGLTYIGFRVSTSAPELALADPAVEPAESVAPVAQPAVAPDAPEPAAERERVATESALDWVVEGLATDANGNAVGGVDLLLGCFDGYEVEGTPREEVRVATAVDGTFTWALEAPVGAATVQVKGADADYYVYSNETTALADAKAPTLRVLAHPRDVIASGRTVDSSGIPIAGAFLEALGYTTRSGSEGEFRLRLTSHRPSIRLHAGADGYAVVRTHLVPLGPGELSVDDVVLPAATQLQGIVRDERGIPLEGVIVRVGFEGMIEAHTAADGRFVAAGLNPERGRHWIELEKAGHARFQESLKPADLVGEREFVLATGGELIGRVVDDQGQPVEAAHITVGNPPDTLPHRGAWSGPEGHFRVTDIEPGSRKVWVARSGFADSQWVFDVPTPEHGPAEVELVLGAGSSISGLVLDPDGAPLAGVMVYGEGWRQEFTTARASTDAEGRFLLTDLPDFELTLGFLESGFARQEVERCMPGTHDLVVRLERSGGLAGLVVDDATGAPVQSFRVRLVTPRLLEGEERLFGYSALWSADGVTFTDTDGVFHLNEDELDAGRVIGVEVIADGYAPSIADHAVTTPNPDPNSLVIRLGAGVVVTGRVIEQGNGAAVSDARVRCLRAGQQPFSEPDSYETTYAATTDSRGRFEFEGLPAGEVLLVVEHERFATNVDGPFAVHSSTERRVEVHPGASVDVRLLDMDGRSLPAESIALFRIEPRAPYVDVPGVETDDAGNARFERLQPGVYQASWIRRGGKSSVVMLSGSATLAEQGRADVTLRPTGSVQVSGTLTFPAEFELPELQAVQLIPREPGLSTAERARRTRGVLAEHGYFEFEGVEPGSYLLHCAPRLREPGIYGVGQLELELSADEQRRDLLLEVQLSAR